VKRRFLVALGATTLIAGSLGSMAQAAVPTDSAALRAAVTLDGVREHQAALQAAADANGGTRSAGTPGYDASLAYVIERLTAAGYSPVVQPFAYGQYVTSNTVFERISPDPRVFVEGFLDDFNVSEYSPSGNATAPVQAVDVVVPIGSNPDNTSTSGCEAADFSGFTPGRIALLQRGSCDFVLKAANAEAAGASGVILFNEGQPGRDGTIFSTIGFGNTVGIPVFDTTYAAGEELVLQSQAGETIVHMQTTAEFVVTETANVYADTAGGRDDRLVVVGAHLDSVHEGPGIQDNGSGSAAILEIAEQFATLGIEPRNKVRFAWWGGEEDGLIGSTYYVSQLDARGVRSTSVNLNFDMIGSPNFVRFVYDGDGSATGAVGPNGSANVEQVFNDYFAAMGLPVEPTAFDGRSDYGPFIAVGIPAGGLFTGAEGIKTPEEVAIYGGTAGEQYDPCYHLACDTFDNISLQALDEMSDAAAHATLAFAMTTSSLNGTDKASSKSVAKGLQSLAYRGSFAQR
jgi:Zn-dependent M28 family amino/carboxypeptidase